MRHTRGAHYGNCLNRQRLLNLRPTGAPFIMDDDKSGMHDFEVEIATAELDSIYDAGHVLVDVIGEPFFMTQRRAWKRWGGSDKVIAQRQSYEYVAVPPR